MKMRRASLALLAAFVTSCVAMPTASTASAVRSVERAPAVVEHCGDSHVTIDDVRFAALPHGLGSPSQFESITDDDVAVTTRSWESQVNDGWRVDLSISVTRSAWLATPQQFQEWLVAWQQRPAQEAVTRRVRVGGADVWIGRDQAAWLVRPGVGAVVRLDRNRWPAGDLRAIVRCSVR